MKLKSKLKLSFLGIAMMPLAIVTFCVLGLLNLQVRHINEYYGVDSITLQSITSPLEIISLLTESVHEQLVDEISGHEELLMDREAIRKIDQNIKKGMELVVRKNGEYYYISEGVDIHEVGAFLPKYQALNPDSETVLYHGGSDKCVIRQMDIEDKLGNQYSVFLITFLGEISGTLHWFWIKIIITVIVLLLLISAIMTSWIYNGTIIPLGKLSNATKSISEGNLDFEIIPTGDLEIKKLGADFELMRRKLLESRERGIQADKQSRELIRNISHDLKTPITAIKGYVEGLRDGIADTDEKREKYLKTIYNKAIDMDRLIDELTLYSQIDANKAVYHYDRLNVQEFFEDCRDSLMIELEAKGVDFEYENSISQDVEIIADAEQLSKVVNNIIGNSLKYHADRKLKIALSVQDEGDFIRVEMKDNGIGISKEDLPHIFERSYRADQSRSTATGGSGIGLSIVKTIIEDHGGKIWAESKLGEETKMCFVLRKYIGGSHE